MLYLVGHRIHIINDVIFIRSEVVVCFCLQNHSIIHLMSYLYIFVGKNNYLKFNTCSVTPHQLESLLLRFNRFSHLQGATLELSSRSHFKLQDI